MHRITAVTENGGNGNGGNGNGGNGNGGNGNGKVIRHPDSLAVMQVLKKAFSCPECLGDMPSGQNLIVEGGVGFNNPSSGSWFSWAPTQSLSLSLSLSLVLLKPTNPTWWPMCNTAAGLRSIAAVAPSVSSIGSGHREPL